MRKAAGGRFSVWSEMAGVHLKCSDTNKIEYSEYQKEAVMSGKKNKPIDLKNLEPEEKLKYEIAEELGLLDRVLQDGWRSLSSKETGRIGGMVTRRKRMRTEEEEA